MPFGVRQYLKFYDSATLNFGSEMFPLNRHDNKGLCLVLLGVDGSKIPFRIEDFSEDKNGDGWVHGAWLYTAAQLPTDTQKKLPVDFDWTHELVESVNRVMESLLEIKSVVRVISEPKEGRQWAGRVFVDDMVPQNRAWRLFDSKRRDPAPSTDDKKRPRRH